MMLEDRYYHSPRTQLTPLVRSVQNSLDVRDKSVSGTDEDTEPTVSAPTLGAPGSGSSRLFSKTPPTSHNCHVPRVPRTDRHGHFLRTSSLQSLEICDPPRKQYRSIARPMVDVFDPSCFPGARAVHQIYLANQTHQTFYPPPVRRRKNKLLSQILLPFSVPNVIAPDVTSNCGSFDGIESDKECFSIPLSDVTDSTSLDPTPYSHRLLSLMLAQPSCARLLHFNLCVSNDLMSPLVPSTTTNHIDPSTPGADPFCGKSPTTAALSTPLPHMSRRFPVIPSMCLNEESDNRQDSTNNIYLGKDLEVQISRSISVVSDSDTSTQFSGDVYRIFSPPPMPNVLPLRLGGVLLPGDAVLAIHPKTHRVSSCTWYGNRCVMFPDGTHTYTHPLYRDATQREAAYSAARSIRYDNVSNPFVLAGLMFSALSNEIACSPRTRDYDIVSLSDLVLSPIRYLLSAEEVKKMEESLILALSAVKVSM